LGPTPRRNEERRIGFPAEVMAKDMKGVERVTECPRHFFRGPTFDDVSPEGFVLAVFGLARFEEEAAELTYVFWCS